MRQRRAPHARAAASQSPLDLPASGVGEADATNGHTKETSNGHSDR